MVGIDDQDRLTGFSWQTAHADRAYREITIESLSDGSYSWHSDQSVSLVNPSLPMGTAADGGKFWVSENEDSLPTVTSSKELFLQWRSLPSRQTLQKIAFEQALALELPPEVPQDFPSPFATEGKQVVSVPKASANASPSTPTPTTATTVDPLVGIWHWQASAWTSVDHCYLAIGMGDDGELKAKGWETHRKGDVDGTMEQIIEYGAGRAIVGMRDLAITRTADQAYLWRSDKRLPTFSPGTGAGGAFLAPDMAGRLALEAEQTSLFANNRVCRKPKIEPAPGTYQKLTLEEALALELPPELLQGFPSPFATEGPQVASVPKATASASAAPSIPTTTTATAVDPLVGIWQQTDVRYEDCQLVVGQDSRGQLMGISFSTVSRNKLIGNDGPRYPKGTVDWSPSNPSQGFVARKLTIEQGPGDTYTWTSEISFKGNLWEAPTAKSGKIYLSTDQNGNPRISTKKLCMVERAAAGGGSFSKLALDEAIAMELPSIAQKDFPSPFVTEGQQVASVPKATTSASTSPSTSVTPTTTTTTTTATTTVVDPLVGIWLRERSNTWPAPFCYAIFGQKPDGTLSGVSWEEIGPGVDITWWAPGYEYRDVPPRKLAIKSRNNNSYDWQTGDIGHFPGDGAEFRLTAMQGILSINITGEKTTFSSATKPLCRRHRWMTSPNRTYYKLSLKAAATLELPAEVEQLLLSGIIPSPFELNTQWGSSALIGQEVTGAAQTTGTTPDSSDSDRR
jgi:hypothetical protein